jgi:hypothetical protein
MESSSGSNIESLITSILAAATGTVTRLLRFSEYPDNHHLLVVVLYEKLRYCTEITGMHNPQFQEVELFTINTLQAIERSYLSSLSPTLPSIT